MEKLKTVLDLLLRHHTTLGYGLVTLLTAGGERIFSTVVFECPCNATWNLSYGLVFLLVPALALFLLGYVLDVRTWYLLTGCCSQGARTCCSCGGTGLCGVLQVFSQLTGMAAVAPLTWVAVALLGGAFYECAASGSKVLARRLCSDPNSSCTTLLPLVPCGDPQAAEVLHLRKDLKAQSQVLGWILIAAVIIGLLIFVSITRCLSPVSFLQLKFWKIYLKQEQEALKSQATEHASKLAKENVECFFECSPPKEFKTPSLKDWQQISSLYTFSSEKQYYSLLHKHVSEKGKAPSIGRSEGGSVVRDLSSVDKHGISTTSGL